MEQNVCTIGQSVVIKGDLSAKEDLTIEGQVEGTIELDHSVLTVGPKGAVKAQVSAKTVIVMGKVNGNITATEKVQLHETASVNGDLVAPCVGIVEGATVQGQIAVQGSQTPKAPAAGKGFVTHTPQQAGVALH